MLVVSELVTNAMRHAYPPVALLLARTAEDTVVIEVTDGGPRPTAACSTDGLAEGGRGTSIVAALSAGHGARRGPDGAVHWAELRLPLAGT